MLRARPERRRRGDLVAAAALVVLLVAGVTTLALTSDVAGTSSSPAAAPIAVPPPAPVAFSGFAEAWRRDDSGTAAPVVSGPAVVTVAGGIVTGRDAATGEARWTYGRDLPLCGVAAGFPAQAPGRVLALYESGVALDAQDDAGTGADVGTYCSELSSLVADTGARDRARNPDARPGARMSTDDTYLLLSGTDHLEVLRSDLVRTLEYGAVPAQEQAARQPRPGCTYGSAGLGGRRVGVVERCPGEATDRLTVMSADGESGAEEPEVRYSVPLAGSGAVLVALTQERAAVALPGEFADDPVRLAVFDAEGGQIGVTEVDLPTSALAGGGIAQTSTDGTYRYWFTGSSVVALTSTELSPVWTLPDALGAPVAYGQQLLVPLPGGLATVDRRLGDVGPVLPVARDDATAPVSLAAAGRVLLEQRGDDLVALLPS